MPPPRKKVKVQQAATSNTVPPLSATGRPLRHAAIQKNDTASDFIDSGIAISDSESDSDTSDFNDTIAAKPVAKRKRKRSPSPPLMPAHLLGWDGHKEQSPSEADFPLSVTEMPSMPVAFTINVPAGFQGPLTIKLDASDLIRAAHPSTHIKAAKQQSSHKSHSALVASRTTPGTTGFLDLPPELRNHIYKLVFVKEQRRLNFSLPHSFERSSALLRTCSQVAEEGASILYSECEFYFRRNSTNRRPMWGGEGKEVGFEDVHRFMKQIGSTNVGRVRHVFFMFEDAVPCLNPQFKTTEERRYVHDKHLRAAVRLLGDHGRLQTLKLGFFGRRAVSDSDNILLEELKTVKADYVEILRRRCHPDWPRLYSNLQWPKIFFHVADELKKAATRKKKFYPALSPAQREFFDGGDGRSTPSDEDEPCSECGEMHA